MTVTDGFYLVWPNNKPKMIVEIKQDAIDLMCTPPSWNSAVKAGVLSREVVDAAIAVGKDTPEVTDEEQRHIATAWNCDADIEDVIVVRL